MLKENCVMNPFVSDHLLHAVMNESVICLINKSEFFGRIEITPHLKKLFRKNNVKIFTKYA